MEKIYPIKSGRLTIRPYEEGDWKPLHRLKQLPQTHRYNYTKPSSEMEVKAHIDRMMGQDWGNPKERLELVVSHCETGHFMGFTGFKGGDFTPGKTAEIFYTLDSHYFRQGYGTELVRAMLSFGFHGLKLHRIWAGATVENRASWRIMEKLGMRRESHWISDRPKPGPWIEGQGFEETGQWEDGYGYAILREEFETLQE